MTVTNPSRWFACVRYGLFFSLVLALLAGAAYAYRQRVKSLQNSYAIDCRRVREVEDWVALQRLAEGWSAWDRQNADAWLFRADAAQHLGNFALAAECLESIPPSDPKWLPALVSLSSLQFGPLNDPLKGVKTCERLLSVEPKTTSAHQQLIEFYALSLQRRQLEHQIRFAISSMREPPTAYIYLCLIDTMRLERGVESNSRWQERYPDSELFTVARLLQMPEPENDNTTNPGESKFAQVDELFKRYPQNLELRAYQIDLSIRRGDDVKLMGLLSELSAEADEDPRFWRAKGWLHLTRREIPEAKRALSKAIELFPMDWNARTWMADALRSEGNLADAEPLLAIVRKSRELRKQITSITNDPKASTEILTEICEYARQCGDQQVAEALDQRLRRK